MPFLICHILLSLSLVMSAWRLFKGPTAADRILAIDLLAVVTASAVVLHAIDTGTPVFVDVIVVLGVIVFFGTVALARTLNRDS
jgi:multicomponent Na+:H+ antiporter subunit F